MTPERQLALRYIRQQLIIARETLVAFAKSEDDYATECRLTEAAALAGNAADEIEKAAP